MRYLAQQGCDVIAVCPQGDVSRKFAKENIRFVEWKCRRNNKNVFLELSYIFHLRKILKELQPDLVHSFTVRPNLYSAVASYQRNRRWILVHNVTGLGSVYMDCDNRIKWALSKLLNYVLRFSFSRSEWIIFQNPDDRAEYIREKIVPPSKTKLIRGAGVNCRIFRPADTPDEKMKMKKRLYGVSEAVVVLFVGRFIRHKGIYEFLQSAEMVKMKFGEHVRFALLGWFDSGNPSVISENEMNDYCQRGIVENLGFRESAPYYAGADIFCLPSYREGLPVSNLEAMASGLPIVTTDAPGCRETVVEGENGFLVPVRNAAALAEKLECLIRNESLREKMGSRSRELAASEFSEERIVEHHRAIYEELLNPR